MIYIYYCIIIYVIRFTKSNSKCKLKCTSPEMLECIVENFTRETPGMQFSKNKNRYAHMRMAVSKVGLMPIGLVGEVYRYIIEELKQLHQ